MTLEFSEKAKEFVSEIAQTESECFSEPWSEKAVEDFLGYEYNGAVVCLIGGDFAGYATYSCICSEMQICNVASAEKYRRRGVGDAIVKKLAETAKNNGCGVITLEVRSKNFPAIALYEKNGFSVAGVRKKFYKKPDDDALLMNLNLF